MSRLPSANDLRGSTAADRCSIPRTLWGEMTGAGTLPSAADPGARVTGGDSPRSAGDGPTAFPDSVRGVLGISSFVPDKKDNGGDKDDGHNIDKRVAE